MNLYFLHQVPQFPLFEYYSELTIINYTASFILIRIYPAQITISTPCLCVEGWY